jgi:hypothetical protein
MTSPLAQHLSPPVEVTAQVWPTPTETEVAVVASAVGGPSAAKKPMAINRARTVQALTANRVKMGLFQARDEPVVDCMRNRQSMRAREGGQYEAKAG